VHCAEAMCVSGLRTIVGPGVHSLRQGFQDEPQPSSGARGNARLIAGNQPNRTNAAGPVRGGLPPKLSRRLREHIDANIERRIQRRSACQAGKSIGLVLRPRPQEICRGNSAQLSDPATGRAYLGAVVGDRIVVVGDRAGSWLCRPKPLRPALSPTRRHVAARLPMVDVVNAGNTLQRIVENVINDLREVPVVIARINTKQCELGHCVNLEAGTL
jgi:hypothetical protein